MQDFQLNCPSKESNMGTEKECISGKTENDYVCETATSMIVKCDNNTFWWDRGLSHI